MHPCRLKLAREGKERQRQQQNPKAPAGAPAGRKPQAMTSRKALAVAVAAAGESTAGPGAERPPPPHQQGALPQGQGQGQGAMEGVDAKAELSKVKSGRLDMWVGKGGREGGVGPRGRAGLHGEVGPADGCAMRLVAACPLRLAASLLWWVVWLSSSMGLDAPRALPRHGSQLHQLWNCVRNRGCVGVCAWLEGLDHLTSTPLCCALFRLPPCRVKRTREAKDRDKEREGNAVQRDRDGGEGEENMKRPLLGEG